MMTMAGQRDGRPALLSSAVQGGAAVAMNGYALTSVSSARSLSPPPLSLASSYLSIA